MFANPEKNVDQFGLLPGMKVADLGAGSGHYTIAAAKAVGPGGRVYAVDVQNDILQRLLNTAHHQHLNNVEVLRGNIEKVGGTALKEAFVDGAIASNVLFQVEERKGFVEEIRRILKPGGRVMVIDWNSATAIGTAVPANALGELAARDLFEKNGFQFDKKISAGQQHYGLVFKKL